MSWCDTCYGTGWLECFCGGDLCVCGLNEYECPDCDGDYDYEVGDDDLSDYEGVAL